MSASPNNAGLESIHDVSALISAPRPPTRPDGGHEALQALLAFSALHEQIRQRRAPGADHSNAEDPWQLEHFVFDEVLQLVAERALTITGADGVAIALAQGDAIICRASAGIIAPDAGARVDPRSGFSGACLVSGQVVRCDDTEIDPRVDSLSCRDLGARSMLAVPLSAKQTVIGLVEAFSSEAYGFNDSDVRSLSLLAELILAAMKPEEEDRLAEISRRVVDPARAPLRSAIIEPEIEPEIDSAQLLDEDVEVADVRPAVVLATDPFQKSPPGLAVVLALILLAIALGGGLWWNIHRQSGSRAAKPGVVAPAIPTSRPSPASIASTPAVDSDDLPDAGDEPVASSKTLAGLPEVTGVRHWSSADSSTVVIDLQDQVQYEAHRLTNPERIYFDLHDTRLASQLSNRIIDVGDVLLQRVRVAQPVHGVTRVVLETKGASNFSVSLEANPYRLVVEVRKLGTQPQPRARVDLFGPANQTSPVQEAALLPVPDHRTGKSLSSPAIHPEGNPEMLRASTPKLRLALDAGHGGWDLGTVGRKGLLEKDLVLDIVHRLGKLVESRMGAQVIYTRSDDDYVALEKRAEIANLSKADLFLSIHANYSDYPSARGVETYYTNTYSSIRARSRDSGDNETQPQNVDWTHVDIREKVQGSRLLAASVQRALYGTLSAKNPGLSNRGVKKAQYVVLTGTSMPAILAEVSFVSSPTDENNLQSSNYRQHIAEALYQGVAGYEQSSRVKMASASGKQAGQ